MKQDKSRKQTRAVTLSRSAWSTLYSRAATATAQGKWPKPVTPDALLELLILNRGWDAVDDAYKGSPVQKRRAAELKRNPPRPRPAPKTDTGEKATFPVELVLFLADQAAAELARDVDVDARFREARRHALKAVRGLAQSVRDIYPAIRLRRLRRVA